MGKAVYLESKPRYEILDGLRGVAALVVVLYHLVECYPAEYVSTFMAHGYLAVDFFFALSGFVIGYAYDDRWNSMTTWGFFKRRITRLHPMVIMGVLVGVCFFYYSGDCEIFNKVDDAAWWMLLVQAFLLICMIPLPSSMDIRGWGELTSIDGPIWTLMFEYVANIFYALFLRRIGRVFLAVLVAGCAVLTADCTLHLNLFGILETEWQQYSVIGGFYLNPENLYIGYVRLLYPFLCGLLLSRCGKTIRMNNGFIITALMVLVMLGVPNLGTTHKIYDGVYQLVCILLVFPLILSIGAGSTLGKKTSGICIFLGEISFPLYITHYPLIYMHTSWYQRHPDAPLGTHILVGICTLMIALGLAYAALRLYDEPVRAWLKDHWLKKK